MADVARAAAVSVATVSRVLNDDPQVGDVYRERVLAAVAQLQYRPNRLARNLRKQHSASIAVVVPDIENPHFTEMVRAVEDLAYRQGHTVLVCNTDESADKQRAYIEVLIDERVRGAILSPASPEAPELQRLLDLGIPVVGFDREIGGTRTDAVLVDNLGGTRAATQLLIDAGHREIVLIAGRHDVGPGSERRTGYEVAMRAAGHEPRAVDGDFRLEGGRKAAAALLDEAAPPTALIVGNNLMTLGVLSALRHRGVRIPADVSLVMIDDPPWAEFVDPALTAMAQPVRRMAADAMELLLQRVDGVRAEPRRIVHSMELRERASIARPRDT